MLKTNCNKVKENIRSHIMQCVNTALLVYKASEEQKAHPIASVYNAFRHEIGDTVYRIGEYNAFAEWLDGVPSALPVWGGKTHFARMLLEIWLQETDEESKKYKDSEVDKLFKHLITREFFALLKKEQKNGGAK